MNFLSALDYSHYIIKSRIGRGDSVIDATVGNGNDTILLANLVGESGKVYGFDLQSDAINITINRLKENNLEKQVISILDNHENIDKWVKEPINGAMFNLGYLPGSDKQYKTNPNSTINAITHILNLLIEGGLITIVVYTKHDDGYEAEKIEEFLKTLPQKEFTVLKCDFLNQVNFPPYLIVLEKR